MFSRIVSAGTLLAVAALSQNPQKGYVAPKLCQPCHAEIFAQYAATGMGRSFARIDSVPIVEDWSATFTHQKSGRAYGVTKRDGRFLMRRTLIGGGDVVEKPIQYVLGSGNHSRTYLTRNTNGKLAELPLSWYADQGGHWAMSPGYDRPDHSDFRREVPDSCLFCHNGYPSEANGGLAEGIDCQRCHGPGENHALRRGPILNPARLSLERQAEVCLQCHLESASRSIPDSIRRFDREPFSYRPGESLGDFAIYFDRDIPTTEDTITVNHSAYGLRRSRCFLRSNNKLLCTTCHDPHRALRGTEAEKHYTAACRACHTEVHSDAPNRRTGCVACHMPKRRTDDAVHVVITDHWIRRSPPPSDLKLKPERHGRYVGPVRLYYPPKLTGDALDRVYLALGALTDTARPAESALKLEAAVTAARPDHHEFYAQLARAFRRTARHSKAIQYYNEALRRKPSDIASLTELAEMRLEQGDTAQAIHLLENAGARSSSDPTLLNGLAVAYARASRFVDAESLLRRAGAINEELPLTWLNLGVSLQAQSRNSEAAAAYRRALRLQPDFAQARTYLGQVGQTR
jgi:Flp pilus assembly protein TadD